MNTAELSQYEYVYGDETILDDPVESFDGHVHVNGDGHLFPQLSVRASQRLDLYSRGVEDPFLAAERIAPLLTRREARKLGVSFGEVKNDPTLLYQALGPVLMLQQMAQLGVGHVAITPHDYDAREEVERARDLLELDIEFIHGREITGRPHPDTDPSHPGQHLIGLGAEKMPPYGWPVTDVIKFVHDQGGIAIFAHYAMDPSSYGRRALDGTIEAGEPPDALEVFTGAAARIDKSRSARWGRVASNIPWLDRKVAPAGANDRAIVEYDEEHKGRLGLSVGSDAHIPIHAAEAIGVIRAGMKPVEEIKKGRVVVMRKKNLAMTTIREVCHGGRLSSRLEELRQEGVIFNEVVRQQMHMNKHARGKKGNQPR